MTALQVANMVKNGWQQPPDEWKPRIDNDPHGEWLSKILPILANWENNSPRSKQWAIGPSEMGTQCLHCLAARLAGWKKKPLSKKVDAPLGPYIGTGVHAQNQRIFDKIGGEWHAEYPVHTCDLKVNDNLTMPVGGHIDLWDEDTNTTVDWKYVGQWTWDRAKQCDMSQSYRIQASLYGIGLANEHHAPKQSEVIYFNRASSQTMRYGTIPLTFPWDPQPGRWAIKRCQRILDILDQLTQENGQTVANDWIRMLPRADFCYSCSAYPDWSDKYTFIPQEIYTRVPEWAHDAAKGLQSIYSSSNNAGNAINK